MVYSKRKCLLCGEQESIAHCPALRVSIYGHLNSLGIIETDIRPLDGTAYNDSMTKIR